MKKFTGDTLEHYAQISASGADKTSWFNYMKTKGEADDFAMHQIGFSSVSIYRPGLLGRKDKSRTWEAFACKIAPYMPVEAVGQSILSVGLEVLLGRRSISATTAGGTTGAGASAHEESSRTSREESSTTQGEISSPAADSSLPAVSLWYNAGMKKRAADWQAAQQAKGEQQKKSSL